MPSEQQTQKPIQWNHIAVIVGAILVLAFLTFLKGGFHFAPKNQVAKKTLTYEQAKAQVLAETGGQPGAEDKTLEQIAMLDPASFGGSVLGTSTEEQLFPKADEILKPEMLDKIKLKDIVPTNKSTVQEYADQVSFIEASFNTLGMFASLNSEDKNTLSGVNNSSKSIVAALAQVDVPKELVAYHKIKMMYYTTLGLMAESFLGNQKQYSIEDLSSIFFSITEKLDSVKSETFAKYGVEI